MAESETGSEYTDGAARTVPSITTSDGLFYVVPTDHGHQLYADEMDALNAFGDRVESVDDIEERDQVREIEIGDQGENWIIRRLTWQDVAKRLLEMR